MYLSKIGGVLVGLQPHQVVVSQRVITASFIGRLTGGWGCGPVRTWQHFTSLNTTTSPLPKHTQTHISTDRQTPQTHT